MKITSISEIKGDDNVKFIIGIDYKRFNFYDIHEVFSFMYQYFYRLTDTHLFEFCGSDDIRKTFFTVSEYFKTIENDHNRRNKNYYKK